MAEQGLGGTEPQLSWLLDDLAYGSRTSARR